MGALAGAAARLCAGTGLFHLPSLCQRGLVHRLQPETFTLTFVKRLREKKKGIFNEMILLSPHYSDYTDCHFLH